MAATEFLERERKLAAPDGFELPDLQGEPLEPRLFTSTYYDTEDRRLLRAGCTLRRRLENGKNTWQLKVPRDDDRIEVEAPGGPSGPPAELRQLLVALVRGRKLVRVATLRTQRHGQRVHGEDERELAEVVLDSVVVLDGRRATATFSEIEIELHDGDEATLERIESALRAAGAGKHDGRPKLLRTVHLDEEAPGPPASAPLEEHIRARVAEQLNALLAHDPGARLGGSPDDVHGLRVAVRRLRALLRAARDVVEPGTAERLRGELDWLGRSLGPARDTDVLLDRLRSEAETLDGEDRAALEPLLGSLADVRKRAQAHLLETLASDRYLALVDELEHAAAALPLTAGAKVSLTKLADAEFRRLRKAVRRLDEDDGPESLHAVRIKAKRTRYAAELAMATAGKRAKRVVARAKRVQDVIGSHQDAVVAEQRLRELARGRSGRAALVAGRLVERQRMRRAKALDALPGAWRKLERAGRRAWA